MLVVTELDLLEIELQLADFRSNLDVVDGRGTETFAGNASDGVVGERNCLRGMRHDRARIRCDDIFAVTHTNHQRRTLASHHQHLWFLRAHDGNRIRARHFAKR